MKLVEQIVTALLKFLRDLAREPNTLDNAQTPPDVRRRWDAWVRGRLLDKGGGDRPKD